MQAKKILATIALIMFLSTSHAQSVGLVLSGGGAKGLSHIGVIKALEESNIPIDYIAGTSMGAIVAGLYSIGITPEEMLYMFRSEEFASWYKGAFEKSYATYIYRREPSSKIVGVSLKRDKNRPSIKLPVSLIAPYPMDLAVTQIFASSGASAGYNFDSLMIPFRCISADIVNKKPYVLRKGDLGSAVRASMTYPFLFKPIIIDSLLMFDGGLYNNFPWDVMIEDFNPNFIIGSKCSGNTPEPDSENIISHVENMLMVETDYTIPEDLGILIDIKFEDVAIMDFHKVDKIVESGYNAAKDHIATLTKKISRRVTSKEIMDRRLAFRTATLPLRVRDIEFYQSDIDENEQNFIAKTIKNNSDGVIEFEEVKRGFYRVAATGLVNTMYPQAIFNQDDSTFNLRLNVTKSTPISLAIGGNISSSSLNQGYLGVEYNQFARNPWRAAADFNIGRYYSGVKLGFRQDVGINPLWFYEAQFTSHRFDYFGESQKTLIATRISSNIQEIETFATFSLGTPIDFGKSILAKASLFVGSNFFEYYHNKNYTKYDIPDRTSFTYISPTLNILRNTTNYKQFASEGVVEELTVRYTFLKEKYRPGTTSIDKTQSDGLGRSILKIRGYTERYYNLSNLFSLGVSAEAVISSLADMGDYISTMLFMPAYKPSPHSKTLLLERYRAPSFIGLSVTPIVKISSSIFFHLQHSFFQPYRQLEETPDGKGEFGDRYPKGSFMCNFALVWQSPVGPISLSASYYDKEETKWYPQFNIGFQIYNRKALAN